MHLKRLIVGEIVLLLASVLIFRSFWMLLDQYFGSSNLLVMLIIGLVISVLALVLLNHEVKTK
jgi:hypothetical protein